MRTTKSYSWSVGSIIDMQVIFRLEPDGDGVTPDRRKIVGSEACSEVGARYDRDRQKVIFATAPCVPRVMRRTEQVLIEIP